jgi:hypothetical protein
VSLAAGPRSKTRSAAALHVQLVSRVASAARDARGSKLFSYTDSVCTSRPGVCFVSVLGAPGGAKQRQHLSAVKKATPGN